MHVSRSAYIGMAAVTAGLVMLAFAFATGTTPTHGQTPGATGTAAGTVTAAATTPAGTATVAATTPAGTPTRGALTPSPAAATPTTGAALPSTGTGSGTTGNSTFMWVVGAGIILAIFGSTFVLTGVRRR